MWSHLCRPSAYVLTAALLATTLPCWFDTKPSYSVCGFSSCSAALLLQDGFLFSFTCVHLTFWFSQQPWEMTGLGNIVHTLKIRNLGLSGLKQSHCAMRTSVLSPCSTPVVQAFHMCAPVFWSGWKTNFPPRFWRYLWHRTLSGAHWMVTVKHHWAFYKQGRRRGGWG